MSRAPHLVQYQGSKRIIAPEILKLFPNHITRIIEPFAGTCAISILAALEEKAGKFILNDINEPLMKLMERCVNNPMDLANEYDDIWQKQFCEETNNINHFYAIRDQFNSGMQDPARMLFLLARVVKGSIRYNSQGIMNQSCDKRRYGTKPEIIRNNALKISALLKDKVQFLSLDYKEILDLAVPGDLIYLDPPYQGTSNNEHSHDKRYIKGLEFDEFVSELEQLNKRGISYIVSYDGMTGEKKIGKILPHKLGLIHFYINAGISTQSTLNGKREVTYESVYLSNDLEKKESESVQLTLNLA